MKIDIVLSFDYELPLGGIVKDYDHALFDPTDKLIKWMETRQIPITLFADMPCYLQFKKYNINEFTTPFERQIQAVLASQGGGDIQPHIHPHWVETSVSEAGFLPGKRYNLSEYVNDNYPNNIHGIVTNAIQTLNQLGRMTRPNYRCLAFRAGGFSIHPYTKEILESLLSNGILIDSSVVPGYYFESDESIIDFRKTPSAPNWYLSPTGDFSIAAKSGLYEIPIASVSKRLFEIPTFVKMRTHGFRAPEARGKMIYSYNSTSAKNKINKLKAFRMLTVDNYTYSKHYFNRIAHRYVQQFENCDYMAFSLIGHPKTMGPYAFELLDEFVANMRKCYGEDVNFTTYSRIAQKSGFIETTKSTHSVKF